ncbi:MAG TPA: DUF3144 domain-containing protein [Gammaproteobacteria bacterium]|nr:DUF3144 domain-containing protein [Gammaproteobacteria bacterium]
MNSEQPENDYWKNVDLFIDLANQCAQGGDAGSSGSTLLFAAARFSAFLVATRYDSKDALAQDKEKAKKHFVDIYEKMFIENLEEYTSNFDDYIQQEA